MIKFDIFNQAILKVKFLTQEISIMTLILLYWLFHLTSSVIAGSWVEEILEWLAIVSVALTALSELIHAIYTLCI